MFGFAWQIWKKKKKRFGVNVFGVLFSGDIRRTWARVILSFKPIRLLRVMDKLYQLWVQAILKLFTAASKIESQIMS